MKYLKFIASLVFSFLLHLAPAQAESVLFYTSSTQSYVGLGQTVLARQEDGFTFRPLGGGNFMWIDVYKFGPDADHSWDLQLRTPGSNRPTTGTYTDVDLFEFQGPVAPSIYFTGDGRAPANTIGQFSILDVLYDTDESLLSLAVDFIQYEGGDKNRWLNGSLRYNSSMPIAGIPSASSVPEPSSIALLLLGLGLIMFCRSQTQKRAAALR